MTPRKVKCSGFLGALGFGNEDGVLLKELVVGRLMMRCYSVEGKAAAVWVVRALRVELGVA